MNLIAYISLQWRFAQNDGVIMYKTTVANQRIRGATGTLSLAWNQESDKCLWKCAGNTNHAQYETVLTDRMENGKPAMPLERIVREVGNLIDIAQEEMVSSQ